MCLSVLPVPHVLQAEAVTTAAGGLCSVAVSLHLLFVFSLQKHSPDVFVTGLV